MRNRTRAVGAAALVLFSVSPALAAATTASSSALPPGPRAALDPFSVDPLVWIEQKVTASDGATDDLYGRSVAIDGNVAFVGSPNAFFYGGSSVPGAVYVYRLSGGTWAFVQELSASDASAGDRFGTSVALKGNTAVIGAPDASVGATQQGAAYVFTKNANGTWSQAQKISADDGVYDDLFGTSVALDGTTVLVGAPTDYVVNATVGAAYVFTNSGGSWTQVQKLTESDTDIYGFGWSVAVDGTNALVGAVCGFDPGLGDCDFSQGYAFAESDGTWSQVTLPQYPGGTAVALSGDVAVATEGPYYLDPDYGYTQGSANIYTLSNGVWSKVAEFYGIPSGGDTTDDYGDAAAISGNTVLVGADYLTDIFFDYLPGKAYEYTESNGTWSQAQTFSASDNNNAVDYFGSAVALSDGFILVGAEGATTGLNYYQGAAYFYGQSDLGLVLSAPASVGQGQNYVSQAIATNNATAASPAVAVTVAVPAAASFVSASASQGSCNEILGVVTCAFGQIAANGGTATANVTLKATGNVGDTVENTASVSKATPALTASAPTAITACAAGYSEYDGTLAAHGRAIEPGGLPYRAPAGQENGVLTAPAGFTLYVVYQDPQGHRTVLRVPGNELHRYGPAGTYAWLVKAGATGGAYTFCLKHP